MLLEMARQLNSLTRKAATITDLPKEAPTPPTDPFPTLDSLLQDNPIPQAAPMPPTDPKPPPQDPLPIPTPPASPPLLPSPPTSPPHPTLP